MINNLKSLKIDVKQDTYFYPIKLKQNDTVTLNFSIFDDGVKADLTRYTCLFKVNKCDGKGYEIRDATINDNNVYVKCTRSLTQFAGTVLCELCFIDAANDLQKTSFNIIIEVKKQVLASNDSGDLPECIITAVEKLDKDLRDIEETVQKAEIANRELANTISNADSSNSKLESSIKKAESLNINLDNSIYSAKETIEELKKTNSEYTEHINNWDIHLTEEEKKKLLLIEENWYTILEMLNKLSGDSYLIDENGDYLVDENGGKMII